MSSTFGDVVAVTPITSHTYSIDLGDEWCIGTVPNGGYITSTFLLVARTHMQRTHPTRSEPHPINLHLEFLRRTSAAPALFTVKDVKLGSRISNLHITLSQKQESTGKWADEVEGYIIMSNIETESGLSLDTAYAIHPPPLPADLQALAASNEDSNWQLRQKEPFANFRRATQNIKIYLMKPDRRPKDRPLSTIEQWIRFTPLKKGGKWTNDALGFVSDVFPQVVEGYVNPAFEDAANSNKPTYAKTEAMAKFWYPTLSLNLDVKKLLPDEGVDWLFVKVHAKAIHNGRFDLNVEIRDEHHDVVALSSHSALVVGAERNTSGRKNGASKI